MFSQAAFYQGRERRSSNTLCPEHFRCQIPKETKQPERSAPAEGARKPMRLGNWRDLSEGTGSPPQHLRALRESTAAPSLPGTKPFLPVGLSAHLPAPSTRTRRDRPQNVPQTHKQPKESQLQWWPCPQSVPQGRA